MAMRLLFRSWTRAGARPFAQSGLALGVAAMAVALLLTWVTRTSVKSPQAKAAVAPLPDRDPEVDILLTGLDGAEVVRFAAPEGWIAAGPDGTEIASTTSSAEATVAHGADGSLTLRGAPVTARRLVVAPRGALPIRVGKAAYRGTLAFEGREQGIRVVNRVALELYLASVVGSEMYASSTKPAALEAQAIAARTYARWAIDKRGRTPLPDNQVAQAYHGIDRETRTTHAAVDATSHRVLYHDGDLLPAFYHSTCGGFTIEGSALLGSTAPPPLRGGPCGYCEKARFFRWSVNLTAPVLGAMASESKIGPQLTRLDPKGLDADPWATMELRGSSGSAIVNSRKFRALAQRQPGAPLVPSSFLQEIAANPKGGVIVKGRGFGHGVGLCQVGAAEMANRGFTTAQILQHYYPGSVVDSTARQAGFAFR